MAENLITFQDHEDKAIANLLDECLAKYRKAHPNDHPLSRSFIIRQIIPLGVQAWLEQMCV